MHPLGTTRSRTAARHALIAPDSHVRAPLPGWQDTQGIVLISPHLGARFCQYLAEMEAGGQAGPAGEGIERFLFVLEGELELVLDGSGTHRMGPGSYAYLPPGLSHRLAARTRARLAAFEKVYRSPTDESPAGGADAPWPVVGHEQDVPGEPFQGDERARLQLLLPAHPAFDMAVNLFTFQPGAALPQVEVHVMEHGLLMLQGGGVYRLEDAWYPVQAGDCIWMAPYCPQWFCAVGREPARYLYYKDVHREPWG